MKLTKTHRSALLFRLKEAEMEERRAQTAINHAGHPDDDRGFDEIDHYLAKEKMRIITEALTENEIDY